MKTASIISIEEQLFDLSDLKKKVKAEGYTLDQSFGNENEYTLNGLID